MISEMYLDEPMEFDDAFEQMVRVGKPGIRRYYESSQVLFWLAEDGVCKEDIAESDAK